MTSVAAHSAGPGPSSSSGLLLHPVLDELPKRSRSRTRKRKSAGASATQGLGQEEEGEGDHEKQAGESSAHRTDHLTISGTPVSVEPKEKTKAPTITKPGPAEPRQAESVATPASAEAATGRMIQDEDSGDEDQDPHSNTSGGKRKRSRKRYKKGGAAVQPGPETDAASRDGGTQPAKGSLLSVSVPNVTNDDSRKQLDQTPNPDHDGALSQGAKNALSYAYIFHSNRQLWKFQKAREAWLLRHILDHPLPPHASDIPTATIAAVEAEKRTDTVSGEASEVVEEQAQTDNSIPPTYIALVGLYLSTMQGRSKDRLKEQLQRAIAEQEALPTEEPLAEASTIPIVSTETESKGQVSATKVGVRFADMADETNEEAQGAGDLVRLRREHIRWRGARARSVLRSLEAQ